MQQHHMILMFVSAIVQQSCAARLLAMVAASLRDAHCVVEDHLSAVADHGEQVVLVDALGGLRQPPLLDHQRVQPQLLVRLLDDLRSKKTTGA